MRSPVRALAALLAVLLFAAVLWLILALSRREAAAPGAPAPDVAGPTRPAAPSAHEAPQSAPADLAPPAPGMPQPQTTPGAAAQAPGKPAAPLGDEALAKAAPRVPDPRVRQSSDGKTVLQIPFDLSRQLHAPNARPEDDLGILTEIYRYYRKIHGEHPVAHGNRQIIDALAGENPRAIVMFDPDHPDRNRDGELLDRYGNPYFFHAISATVVDIVSAGPDGVRGTLDDTHSNPGAGAELKLRAEPALD